MQGHPFTHFCGPQTVIFLSWPWSYSLPGSKGTWLLFQDSPQTCGMWQGWASYWLTVFLVLLGGGSPEYRLHLYGDWASDPYVQAFRMTVLAVKLADIPFDHDDTTLHSHSHDQ